MTTSIEIATSYGYSVEPWDKFRSDKELPEGLLTRALKLRAECESRGEIVTHVLYDTADDDQGFLVLGDNPEEICFNLADGPLSSDERWDGMIRPSASPAMSAGM